jgi:pyruvate,water dikinase
MAACYGLTQFEYDPVRDLEAYTVWPCDLTHHPRPPRPLNAWLWSDGICVGQQYGAEMMSLPEIVGWDIRLIDGYVYFGVMEVKPEEVPEREKVFAEKIRPFIEDWEGQWKQQMEIWIPIVEEFKAFDLERASNLELRQHFEDFFVRIHRTWRPIHFYMMLPTFGLYGRFAELCKELLGMDNENPLFKALVAGFDNRLFNVNRDLWQFGDRARELGLADLFLTTQDDKELLSKLEESEAGRKWLKEYRKWLEVEGWRNIDLWDVSSPSWIEDHSLPLRDIKQAVAKGGVFALNAARDRLSEEREKAEKEVLGRVPAEQREFFEKLLRVAQKASRFSEEHNWYLDQHAAAISRRIFLEIGKRFAQNDVIDERDDIFFLFPDEIRKASIAMGRVNLRPYVKAHKEEWESYCKIEPKLWYGDFSKFPEVARKDPIMTVMAAPPRVKPELEADLYAATTSPGVVEGVARVILSERDLNQLQPGEILVTVATAVPWTPAFSVIAGVVTNAGGSLAHAVLVAREYGIPAAIGTREATKKIKTGDKIKVDGDAGAVYILEKAA